MSDQDAPGDGSVPQPKRDTRFKPGESGNKAGRPRKAKVAQPEFDVGATLREALGTKGTLTLGKRKVSKTAGELGIITLVSQFAKGDRHARRDLFDLAQRTGVDVIGEHRSLIEDVLSPSHQAILDEYVARRTGMISASSVIAPPELMDGL